MGVRRGRILRASLAVSLLIAVAACEPAPSATPTPAPVASPTPAATPLPSTTGSTEAPTAVVTPPAETQAAGAPPCEPSDLKASHGLVEGAAGSRLTSVILSAAVPCSVDLFPAFGLRDANGNPLVGAPAAGPGRIDLDPDRTYESNVQLANWCADEPALPLRFELLVEGESVEVTGTGFPEAGDLPPCNGDTLGPVLEAGPWVAKPD